MSNHGSAAEASGDLLKLVSEIVASYVSNNPVPVSDLPAMIRSVHATLGGLTGSSAIDAVTTQKPAVPVKKSITPELSGLPRRRQEAEDAQALSAFALWLVARSVPHEMGPSCGLSDGRVELCSAALRVRQEDRTGPQRTRQGPPPRIGTGAAFTFRRVPFSGCKSVCASLHPRARLWRRRRGP